MGSETASIVETQVRLREENIWLEASKYIWGIPLMMLLIVIVAVISPMLLWLYIWEKAHSPAPENSKTDRTCSGECHDYQRGYAQAVEDMNSLRRGDAAAERLRRELR